MNIKEFFRPNIPKILIFLFAALAFLYFAKEDVCGAGFIFAFCYKAYGFPFDYIVTGNVDAAFGHIKTLPFGQYFYKSGNFLLNPAALLVDVLLVYLLACFIASLFRTLKSKPT